MDDTDLSGFYFFGFIVFFMISLVIRKKTSYFSIVTLVYLIVGAGLRTDGWDWDNWMYGIELIRSSDDWDYKAQVAKDPIWLFIVTLTDSYYKETWLPVFILVSSAVLIKAYALKNISVNSFKFFSLYGLLLSPELEFSGMRSALAASFLVLMITSDMQVVRYFSSLFAVSSHLSSVVHLVWYIYKQQNIKYLFIIALFTFFILASYDVLIGEALIRFGGYVNQITNIGALLLPSAFIISWYILLRGLRRNKDVIEKRIIELVNLIYGFSLGSAFVMVTISHRTIEFGNVLNLLLFVYASGRRGLNMNIAASFLIFFIILIMRHFIIGNYFVVRW